MELKKSLFSVEEINDLLKEMMCYGMDGEIEADGYILTIDMTEDSAGEDGWVFFWELGKTNDKDGDEDIEWLDGDGYFYSTDELIESLEKSGIVQ
jgi:hypothetical protein